MTFLISLPANEPYTVLLYLIPYTARSYELKNVLNLLSQKEIRPLLLKGTPLAHSHYPQPYLRSRCDTDLLFANKESADNAWHLLKEQDYQRPNAVSWEFISHQFTCYKKSAFGVTHTLDTHWQLSNRQFSAKMFSFSELQKQSIPLPALGPHAFSLCPIHALHLACMHRVAHKEIGLANRLLWLYDIHLLSSSLTKSEWEEFTRLAAEKSLCNICRDGLQQTRKQLATPIPAEVMEQLKKKGKQENFTSDMSKSYLKTQIMDIRALSGWQPRLQFLRENLFPNADYILKKYNTNNKWLLPFLYLRRVAEGVIKLLR